MAHLGSAREGGDWPGCQWGGWAHLGGSERRPGLRGTEGPGPAVPVLNPHGHEGDARLQRRGWTGGDLRAFQRPLVSSTGCTRMALEAVRPSTGCQEAPCPLTENTIPKECWVTQLLTLGPVFMWDQQEIDRHTSGFCVSVLPAFPSTSGGSPCSVATGVQFAGVSDPHRWAGLTLSVSLPRGDVQS